MENLLYSTSHEWVLVNGSIATIGISDFAQAELGDITYIDLPAVGTKLVKGKEFASVESVKAASDIYSPVDGEVLEINEHLEDAPEVVNADPYRTGWFVKVKLSAQPSGLLDKAAYKAQCKSSH